jgi:hypothetical protein
LSICGLTAVLPPDPRRLRGLSPGMIGILYSALSSRDPLVRSS